MEKQCGVRKRSYFYQPGSRFFPPATLLYTPFVRRCGMSVRQIHHLHYCSFKQLLPHQPLLSLLLCIYGQVLALDNVATCM